MANPSNANCTCRCCKGSATQVRKGQLGLDELMIVNPAQLEGEALILAKNGRMYRVKRPRAPSAPIASGAFFLGDGGTLYQVQSIRGGCSPVGCREGGSAKRGHYFLGADGTLYEVVPK